MRVKLELAEGKRWREGRGRPLCFGLEKYCLGNPRMKRSRVEEWVGKGETDPGTFVTLMHSLTCWELET